MLKKDLVQALVDRRSIPQRKAQEIVEHVFDCMRRALARGETIELRGLGRFHVKQYDRYTVRNPRTAAALNLEPSRRVLFRTGKDLRERMNADLTDSKSGRSTESAAGSTPRARGAESAA
jgi:integration host factor subunit beta